MMELYKLVKLIIFFETLIINDYSSYQTN